MSLFHHFSPKKPTFRKPIINFGIDEENKKKRRKIVASPLLAVGSSKKSTARKGGGQLDIDYVYNTGRKRGKSRSKKCRQRHVRFAFNQNRSFKLPSSFYNARSTYVCVLL